MLDGASSESDVVAASDSEPEQRQPPGPLPKVPCRRGTRNVVTREVAAALDRTATSDRNAGHILFAMASTSQLGQNADTVDHQSQCDSACVNETP